LTGEACDTDDEESGGLLKEITDSVRRTQALSLTNSHVLAEIVRQLVDAATDRHDYLVGMFERVRARAENSGFDKHVQPADGLLRVEISKFFAEVAGSSKALRRDDHAAPGRRSRKA
jgi:hypothetical protein